MSRYIHPSIHPVRTRAASNGFAGRMWRAGPGTVTVLIVHRAGLTSSQIYFRRARARRQSRGYVRGQQQQQHPREASRRASRVLSWPTLRSHPGSCVRYLGPVSGHRGCGGPSLSLAAHPCKYVVERVPGCRVAAGFCASVFESGQAVCAGASQNGKRPWRWSYMAKME